MDGVSALVIPQPAGVAGLREAPGWTARLPPEPSGQDRLVVLEHRVGDVDDAEQSEVAPVEAEEIEAVIDANPGPSEIPAAFDNIETGVLEHDIATHDPAPLDETDEGDVLDLGNVEGLSGAPSSMREMVGSGEPHESDLSDRMEKPG